MTELVKVKKGSDRDERSDNMSFADALTSLELSATTYSIPSQVVSFLTSRATQLRCLANPFVRLSASKAQIECGKVNSGGKPETITEPEKEIIYQIAARFDIDEVEAFHTLRAVKGPDVHRLHDDDWDSITAYIFEERTAVIGIVGLLLRCHENESHACHMLAVDMIPLILHDSFTSTILKSFADRTSQSLPTEIRASRHYSLFWAKQLVREQKALLEIAFLVFYTLQPANGLHVKEILDTLYATQWGEKQALFGYFDAETRGVVREIGVLLTIIAIESLNLESAIACEYPVPSPKENGLADTDIYHPRNLSSINNSIENLVRLDSIKSSPILLGWAFILSKVTNSLVDRGVPESYHEFASTSLRVDISSGQSRTSSTGRPNSQPLYQLYAAHALSSASNLFPAILYLCESPVLAPSSLSGGRQKLDEPNAVGYVSVLRAILACLPLLIRLSFLTSEQYSGLLNVFTALFQYQAASQICSQFWEESNSNEDTVMGNAGSMGEVQIVDLAKSRFPVQFAGFLSIVKSLCRGVLSDNSGKDELSDDAVTNDISLTRACAEHAFQYLNRLDTLAHVVPSIPTIPLPYEIVGYGEDNREIYHVTRPIIVSKQLVVPIGTPGRLVSEQGRKPVVIAWELEWSGWKLFADVLEDYAESGRNIGNRGDVFGGNDSTIAKPLPVEWESEDEQRKDIINILDLLRLIVLAQPSLATRLLGNLDEGSDDQQLTTLFRLVEASLSETQYTSTDYISSLIKLITALLPSFPRAVWRFLRGSDFLFPSSTASMAWSSNNSRQGYSHAEKLAGTFPVTSSLVSLGRALVLEYQVSLCVIDSASLEVKQNVLVRVLNWIRDEVWSTFSSWRFADVTEKDQLATTIIQLYGLVLDEAEVMQGTMRPMFDPVVQVVVECLLTNSTPTLLSPLLFAINAGPEVITLQRKAFRFGNAQVLEGLAHSSLILIHRLLQLRRRLPGPSLSLLEEMAFYTGAQESMVRAAKHRRGVFESLTKFVTASEDPKVAYRAAQVLSVLCITLGGLPSTAISSSSFLADTDDSESFVNGLMNLASNPQTSVDLQGAVWDLISAIVEGHPSLALILITGQQYPFDNDSSGVQDKVVDNQSQSKEDSGLFLAISSTPSHTKKISRTAMEVALKVMGTWERAWEEQPAVLAAVLRFLDFVWQHFADYGSSLSSLRSHSTLFKALLDIAFKDPEVDPTEEHEVIQYCQRMTAKAHAVRVTALDVQLSFSQKPGVCIEILFSALGNKAQLTSALTCAFVTSLTPQMHSKLQQLISQACPALHLESLRQFAKADPLDTSRQYGPTYLYSLRLLRRRLDGLNSGNESMVDAEDPTNIVVLVAEFNLNLSMIDAQMSNTRSLRQLLETILPFYPKNPAAMQSALGAAALAAGDIADEERSGQVMNTIHCERLSILLAMVELLKFTPFGKAKDVLVTLASETVRILTSAALPPLESVMRLSSPCIHGSIFRIAFFVFQKLSQNYEISKELYDDQQRISLASSTDTILRVMITATRDLFVLARASESADVEQDLSLCVAVVSQIVQSPFMPSPTLWLSYCHEDELFRMAFEVFVYVKEFRGRPMYAQHVLDMCVAMSLSNPQAAEQMALAGLMTALTNNALTASAEAGEITVFDSDGSKSAQHELWIVTLALVNSLIVAMHESTRFVELEITGFIRLYKKQLMREVSWNAGIPLSLPALEEMLLTVTLIHGITRSKGDDRLSADSAEFVQEGLGLLQNVVYVLLHPNHLAALIRPVDAGQRALLDRDLSQGSSAELGSKPIVAVVTIGLLRIAKVILDTLLIYTEAFQVLTRHRDDWLTDKAIIIPTATVSSSEDASIGTLLDLASVCLDILRSHSSDAKALGKGTADAAGVSSSSPHNAIGISSLPPYSPFSITSHAQEILESVLLLSTSQLALWLHKPDPVGGRPGASMRREITGELAGDLINVLDSSANLKLSQTDNKAKIPIASTGTSTRKSTRTTAAKKEQHIVQSEAAAVVAASSSSSSSSSLLVEVLRTFVQNTLIEA